MRMYELRLTDPVTNKLVRSWESHPNSKFDAQAQNIQFDIPTTSYDIPIGGQIITIEGVALRELSQAIDYVGLQFTLRAGMASGLPLANPLQSGVISSGTVTQSFGNWEGTEMTLDLVVYPSAYSLGNSGNIVTSWTIGTPLADALKTTLTTAYPDTPVNINISPSLMLGYSEFGWHESLEGLAEQIMTVTAQQGHPVRIALQAGIINVFDDTYTPKPIQLNFNDLIGQPTWISINTVQIKLVMRGDISIGSKIKMPTGITNSPGFANTTADGMPNSQKNKPTFSGEFSVVEMRHLGNFRSADGASWVTLINCVKV